MNEIIFSPWIDSVQAIFAISGTWLLAFGLKSIREPNGFDTSNPHPLSIRFWIGLIFLTLSILPSLVSSLIKIISCE